MLWYKENGRDLPWRKTHDPYTILVSELMLQQTQVDRVVVKLPLFIKKFPSFSSLAAASVSEVIRAWQGMGYKNRIMRFQKVAQQVVSKYEGILPSDPLVLETLPGIGKYTAHAVACFAFNAQVPVVDINVRRIYSRVFYKQKFFHNLISEEEAWKKAEELLPKQAYDFNQALMDIGSTICKATAPKCMKCPIASHCKSANRLIQGIRTTSAEPNRDGVPNRIYRGKIVEYLRNHGRGKTITIAKSVVPGYTVKEQDWLICLIRALIKDGLITEKEGMLSLP